MLKKHRKVLNLGNHIGNLVGQPFYGKKPTNKQILESLLDAMSDFTGTCWAPVEEVKKGKSVSWNLMLNQCPGACGHVWKLLIKDKSVCDWLVNEINQRRWGENGKHIK